MLPTIATNDRYDIFDKRFYKFDSLIHTCVRLRNLLTMVLHDSATHFILESFWYHRGDIAINNVYVCGNYDLIIVGVITGELNDRALQRARKFRIADNSDNFQVYEILRRNHKLL